jgi:hypothetical protein
MRRRSWKLEKVDERCAHNEDSSNVIFVIEDFVVIAVESKIGLFLLNNRSMFLGSVKPYCKGYICLF